MCDCESVYLIHGVFSQHASFAETSYFHLLLKLMKAFEPTFEPWGILVIMQHFFWMAPTFEPWGWAAQEKPLKDKSFM